MKDKCATCAFRPGTEANLSPNTIMKAKLCADICDPFYCHETLVDGEGTELCAGWVQAVDVLFANGHYENQSKWHKKATEEGIALLIALENGEIKNEADIMRHVEEFYKQAEAIGKS